MKIRAKLRAGALHARAEPTDGGAEGEEGSGGAGSGHSSLEGGKIENKLTGAGINAKKCRNTSLVTT